MMLDWLGEADGSSRLEEAVAAVIREGKARTYDMGGSSTTMEIATGIAYKLSGATGARGAKVRSSLISYTRRRLLGRR
jgi:hypothetical protein